MAKVGILEVLTRVGDSEKGTEFHYVVVSNIVRIVPRVGSRPCCEVFFVNGDNMLVFDSAEALASKIEKMK